MEKREISIKELKEKNVIHLEKKDDNPRGVKTVSADEIKVGDKVVIDNYFHLVTK